MMQSGEPRGVIERGDFYISRDDGGPGGMYVQSFTPVGIEAQMPVVLIHGGGMNGSTFIVRPDGEPSWAERLASVGHAVYVVDVPGYGRSRSLGPFVSTGSRTLSQVVRTHTAPSAHGSWPQARLHTQWPGAGEPGDPVFDSYFASLDEVITETAEIESMMRIMGKKLLERIGPAVLLGHSQGGRLAFALADNAPHLVSAVVAVEPNGPPLFDVAYDEAEQRFQDGTRSRPWGITCTPVSYHPPVDDPEELSFERRSPARGGELVSGWMQTEPARQLVNLQAIPVLVISGEASYHASYDHCTAEYLAQAGVPVGFVRLKDLGIMGNGHIMMSERNGDHIIAYIARQIAETTKAGAFRTGGISASTR